MNIIKKIFICTLFFSMGTGLIIKATTQQELAEQVKTKAEQVKANAQAKVAKVATEKATAQAKAAQVKAKAAADNAKEKAQQVKKQAPEKIDKKCEILFYHEKTKELVGVLRDLKEVEEAAETQGSHEKGSKKASGFLVHHAGRKIHVDGTCHHPRGEKDKEGKSLKGECRKENRWYYFYCPHEKSEKESLKSTKNS